MTLTATQNEITFLEFSSPLGSIGINNFLDPTTHVCTMNEIKINPLPLRTSIKDEKEEVST